MANLFITMVVLNVKRDQRSLFLLESALSATVGEVLATAVAVHNGRLKVRRLADEVDGLAEHGTALPPEMRGLLEEQIAELKLTDDEGDACQPSGGAEFVRDPLQRRTGRAPKKPEMKEVLKKTAEEARKMVSEENAAAGKPLTEGTVREALKVVRGAVTVVYPMGLPRFDPVRMELDNAEELDASSEREVIDPAEATLWFANRELDRGEPLSRYLGRNEKTKVVVKLSTRRAGQPCSESWLDEEAQKKLAMDNFKRMQELKRLEQDEDDSYLDSRWADGGALKKKFQGLESVSWKPK